VFKKPGVQEIFILGYCFEVAFRLAGRILFGINYRMLNMTRQFENRTQEINIRGKADEFQSTKT